MELALILTALFTGIVCFMLGVLIERVHWNDLIYKGIIPAPKGKRIL